MGIKMKKKLVITVTLIFAIAVFLFVYSGFGKRVDVSIHSYAVSEDGTTITVQTSLAGSMGYIRDITYKKDGDKIYASFYGAFGGLNSKIGAKNNFEIEVDASCKEIYFDRGKEGYKLVLRKEEATNEWIKK